MKKLILIISLLGFIAAPALAIPSLGGWEQGAPGSTHQFWDFTGPPDSDYVVADGPGTWYIYPEEVFNPSHAEGTIHVQNPSPDSWVPQGFGFTTYFYDYDYIRVDLQIENYPRENAYKEIWVDIDWSGVSYTYGVQAIGPDPDPSTWDYTVQVLPGQGDADFGFRIWPNPYEEKIWIEIVGGGIGASPTTARLASIDVDTICVPAPGAILLASMGVGLVGWLRRRRTL